MDPSEYDNQWCNHSKIDTSAREVQFYIVGMRDYGCIFLLWPQENPLLGLGHLKHVQPNKKKKMPVSDKSYLSKYLTKGSDSTRIRSGSEKVFIPKSYGAGNREEDEEEDQPLVESIRMSSASVEKKRRHDSDDEVENKPSEQKKTRRHDSDEDDSDISPPRREVPQTTDRRRHDSDDDLSPVRNRPSESVAGSSALLEFSKQSGRDAETIFRHPETKKIISKEEYLEIQKKKKRQTKKITQNELSWSKGLKQQEEWKEMNSEFDKMKSSEYKPIYEKDASYNEMLRKEIVEEDPMSRLITEKRKEKESSSSGRVKKVYHGPYPENRFGIKPGWRWDGVDRSNGFEKQYFKSLNTAREKEEQELKWNNADL